jgi:hypothetical protein
LELTVIFSTGPLISSYAVQDKAQVADIDPSIIVDDDSGLNDDNIEPCMICNHFGDESLLLLCDSCNQSCHVFCAGLDAVPTGAWFCYDCHADPQIWAHSRPQPRPQPARRAPIERRGNRAGPSNRARNIVADNRTTWARVWHSVANATDIDLEFPFDDDNRVTDQRSEAERQEFRAWQRRFQITGRIAGPGALNGMRHAASTNPPQSADPESQEEIKAWNAFEKARILVEAKEAQDAREKEEKEVIEQIGRNASENQDSESGKKKEKKAGHSMDMDSSEIKSGESSDTRTAAPRRNNKRSRQSSAEVEERPPEPSRKRKRPRTLRMQEGESASESTRAPVAQEPSRATSRNPSISAPQALPSRADTSAGPTFLQSLLEEVDHVAVNRDGLYYDVNGEFFPYGLERSASPESSPVSGHATPRSMTPPPLRPASPVQPSSLILPIFPPAPDILSDSVANSLERARSRQRAHLELRSPATSPTRADTSPRPSSPTSPAASPKAYSPATTSHQLGIKTKSEVQSLVKSILKPHYKKRAVNAEQYTEINKSICRKLYEQIGTEENFANKEHWQDVAKEEVEQAIGALKTQSIVKPESVMERDIATLPIRGS